MFTFIMAHQTLFDALAAGMDTQATALAVQYLLDQQPVQESSNSAPAEEEDVFQCGKCKKQFTSLPHFMSHKREHCAPPQNSVSRPHAVTLGPSNNSAFTSTLAPSSLGRNVSFGTVPQSASLSQVSSNVLGSDEVLISPFSGVEQNLPLQHSGVLQPSGPFLSSQPPTSRSHGHSLSHGHQHPHHHHQQLQHHQQHQHQQHQHQSYGPSSSSSSSTNHTATTITTLHPVSAPSIQSPPPPPVTASKRQSHSSIPVATVSITESTLSQVTQEILGVGGSRTSPTRQVGQLRALQSSGGQHGGGRRRKDPTSPKKPGKLKCTYCERTFHKNFDLQQHVRSHTGEKPFQCIVCGRAFAQKSNVKKHMSTHKVWPAGNQPTLPDKYILTKVVDGADGSEGANDSTEAEKSDATAGQPQAEVSGHDDHDRKKDTEKDTMEYQTYGENQKQNGDNAEKDKDGKVHSYIDSSYCCPYCPQRFKIYFELKTHMTTHKDEQVYKCIMKDCAQTFKDLDSYLEHTKSHESEMVYRCHLCTKQFPSLYELGVHQYSHSLYPSQGGHQKQKKFRCTECKSKYKSEEALAHHVATTTHNFPCSKCKRVFPCERFLRRHLPSHSTEGDYQCTICSKKFKSDQYLKSHYLMHSGENPFKCATCGKAFNRKDKLKRHALIHDPVKKHKCPFKSLTGCTKAFHRADKLKAHIVSHSGIKPFKCNECNKCFSRKPNLAEHMRAHRDDYDLRCEVCNKGFQRKKHLDAHKCRAHKVDDDDDDTVEISLVDGAVRRPRRASKRKKKSKPLILDDEDEGENGNTNPVVKTKTREVKMKHSGFGKQKKMKKKRKQEFKQIIVKREESPDPDIAEIQKDLEIIRSGMQKQKEEQERLDRERASGDSEPGREKITGSTDPMPIQGTDQTDQTDPMPIQGTDQADNTDQADQTDQGGDATDATDASDGQFVNLGSEDVSGNEDTTAMALLNMSQEDGGHAMDTSM